MKKQLILIAIGVLVLLSIIFMTIATRGLENSREIASKEFEWLLQQYQIDMKLFSGPFVEKNINDGCNYTWKSLNRKIIVTINVPNMIIESPSTKIIGSNDDWGNLYFTSKR